MCGQTIALKRRRQAVVGIIFPVFEPAAARRGGLSTVPHHTRLLWLPAAVSKCSSPSGTSGAPPSSPFMHNLSPYLSYLLVHSLHLQQMMPLAATAAATAMWPGTRSGIGCGRCLRSDGVHGGTTDWGCLTFPAPSNWPRRRHCCTVSMVRHEGGGIAISELV